MFLGNWLREVFFDDALSVRALLCWTKFEKIRQVIFRAKVKILMKKKENTKFPQAFGGECKADF